MLKKEREKKWIKSPCLKCRQLSWCYYYTSTEYRHVKQTQVDMPVIPGLKALKTYFLYQLLTLGDGMNIQFSDKVLTDFVFSRERSEFLCYLCAFLASLKRMALRRKKLMSHTLPNNLPIRIQQLFNQNLMVVWSLAKFPSKFGTNFKINFQKICQMTQIN